jgi:hypothetical protein
MHFERRKKHINTRHEIHHYQLKAVLIHTIAMLVNHSENGMRAGNARGGNWGREKLSSVRHGKKIPLTKRAKTQQ